MNLARVADIMNAVTNIDRRQWISRTLALGTAGTLAGLLQGCGSGSRRDTSLVGKPIPTNPNPAGDYRPATPIRVEDTRTAKTASDWSLPQGVIPRTQWASYGPNVRLADPMGYIDHITVHHDGMPPVQLRSMSQTARRIEQIRRGHRSRGWADIGYHFIVDPQGRVWQGRPVSLQGAHVKNQNPHNLGVLVLGNFEVQIPTEAATASVERFVVSQMHRYRIPVTRVYTHRELAATACPGRNLQRIMVAARKYGGIVANA